MENELSEVVQQPISTIGSFATLDSFKELYDIGKMFASSSLVPDTYQGKSMDCTIAVDMANRMGVSPMFVMQNLYIVKGKPSWSGQACMSMVKASLEFTGVTYEWSGTEKTDEWGCRVVATRKNTGEIIKGTEITIQMAKDEGWYGKNPKWKNMPQQMLMYRASAFFARAYIPNALMGCAVEGEAEDSAKTVLPAAPNPLGVSEKVMKEAEEQFK
jgi:hypothetical protein